MVIIPFNGTISCYINNNGWMFVYLKSPSVNTLTGSFPLHSHPQASLFPPWPPFTYLGTQLGEERSTSQVAYRFMWTGRLEVMLTGLEGCMCGEGTPPVRGSPPRSDILEAEKGLSGGADRRNTRSSLASPCVCVCVVLFGSLLLPSFSLIFFQAPCGSNA